MERFPRYSRDHPARSGEWWEAHPGHGLRRGLRTVMSGAVWLLAIAMLLGIVYAPAWWPLLVRG